ncbi:nuclear RNA export factor 3-like [Onychomys torridus]|uniref:nuclear RNA export factor 3-like n=1 Tax=Onychomys torridus TaxID=38674 RepID=UPI00167F46CA|nr:nuclear RNA export factor 3-like [Onychomys torridus]
MQGDWGLWEAVAGRRLPLREGLRLGPPPAGPTAAPLRTLGRPPAASACAAAGATAGLGAAAPRRRAPQSRAAASLTCSAPALRAARARALCAATNRCLGRGWRAGGSEQGQVRSPGEGCEPAWWAGHVRPASQAGLRPRPSPSPGPSVLPGKVQVPSSPPGCPRLGALSAPKPGFLSQNSNGGHNSQTNPFQRRMKCRGIFRRRLLNSTEHIRDTMQMHTSFHQQQDGQLAMSNSPMYTRRRFTPYGFPSRHQRINLYKQNQMHVNREEEPKPSERKMQDKQDDTSKNWFKVTIPCGVRYDKMWLLNLIQSQCSIPFTPLEFHYEKMRAHFFVDNSGIAFELKSISDKIWDESNNKLQSHRAPSVILQLPLNPQVATSQQVLNMQRLPFDQDLMAHPTDLALEPGRYMAPSLDVCEEDMTQVKSAGERVKGQDPNPEKICADKSSLSTTIPDKSSNINSILELFPKLLSLDGQESRKPTLCGLEDHKSLPTCKGSFFGSEAVKTLVLQFLHQYYFIYDNGDRQGLLNAYHAEACFSFTVLFSAVDSSSSSLWEYFKYSRNMKVLKDSYIRRQLLKHKKCDIIHFLCTLPKTQHDLTSFVVDICFQTETMICFSVSGLFKEVEGSSWGCAHAFTRTFIATYGNSSDLHIINDKLFVRNVQGLPSASIPVTTLPALSQDQQKMVQPGMNAEWSQKFLNDEQWDYNKTIQSLALLKVKDMSPKDTSIQTGPGS